MAKSDPSNKLSCSRRRLASGDKKLLAVADGVGYAVAILSKLRSSGTMVWEKKKQPIVEGGRFKALVEEYL